MQTYNNQEKGQYIQIKGKKPDNKMSKQSQHTVYSKRPYKDQ